MYLFKCKCGCVFTVKSHPDKSSDYFKCQNCENGFHLTNHVEFKNLKQSLDSIGMTMQLIPDDARITVSFET